MKLTISFKSSSFSTWPKSQHKNLTALRMKRVFKLKSKAFSIIFKALSVAEMCLTWQGTFKLPFVSFLSTFTVTKELDKKNRLVTLNTTFAFYYFLLYFARVSKYKLKVRASKYRLESRARARVRGRATQLHLKWFFVDDLISGEESVKKAFELFIKIRNHFNGRTF